MHDLQEPSDPRTFAIIGAGLEVHRVMGPGFGELIYHGAFAIELNRRDIPFMSEVPFSVKYKGHQLSGYYRADFVCFDSIVVEIKANGGKYTSLEQAQMLNYLKASGKEIGLLLNFGGPKLTFNRFVMSHTWEDVPPTEEGESVSG